MVSTIHYFGAILVFLTLLLSTLAADLPAYPLVCTLFSTVGFCPRLTANRLCGIHISQVSANFKIFYRMCN